MANLILTFSYILISSSYYFLIMPPQSKSCGTEHFILLYY